MDWDIFKIDDIKQLGNTLIQFDNFNKEIKLKKRHSFIKFKHPKNVNVSNCLINQKKYFDNKYLRLVLKAFLLFLWIYNFVF